MLQLQLCFVHWIERCQHHAIILQTQDTFIWHKCCHHCAVILYDIHALECCQRAIILDFQYSFSLVADTVLGHGINFNTGNQHFIINLGSCSFFLSFPSSILLFFFFLFINGSLLLSFVPTKIILFSSFTLSYCPLVSFQSAAICTRLLSFLDSGLL